MKFKITREMQVPKGAVKVADKASDAVAYLYASANNGKPAAMVFFGKSDKPVWRHYFATEKAREVKIAEAFDGRRDYAKHKAEMKAARSAPHTLKVGDILSGSWGYDQTNIDFFEVVATTEKTVSVRRLAQDKSENGWLRGTTMPVPGKYTSEATTHRCSADNSIKSPVHGYASKWDGKAENWTAYA